MKRCKKCILPETFPNIDFDDEGICSYCNSYKEFQPKGEKHFLKYLEWAKKKKRKYDVLVPLSGGKDSTFILYLSKKIYNLNVLAYTYDNGFLTEDALHNIKSAVTKLDVDHQMYRPPWETLKKLYQTSLLKSGELCSVCGIGIAHAYLKISSDRKIPLILTGSAPNEWAGINKEDIYDIDRFKFIMRDRTIISKNSLDKFLIYPILNSFFTMLFRKYSFGKFGKVVSPFYYLNRVNEEEIENILRTELNWRNDTGKKHFDCIAEPFTNYIREQRFGYSRSNYYFSNLIRCGEMTREEAIKELGVIRPNKEPENTKELFNKLDISYEKLDEIKMIAPYKYEKHVNKLQKLKKMLPQKLFNKLSIIFR